MKSTCFQQKVYPVRKATKNSDKKERSNFSNGVYQIIKKIPPGKVMTYRQVAEAAGCSQAWRAVGNALAKNRDPRLPCHRVVRANGSVGGYQQGQNKKIALLRSEGLAINSRGKFRYFETGSKKTEYFPYKGGVQKNQD